MRLKRPPFVTSALRQRLKRKKPQPEWARHTASNVVIFYAWGHPQQLAPTKNGQVQFSSLFFRTHAIQGSKL